MGQHASNCCSPPIPRGTIARLRSDSRYNHAGGAEYDCDWFVIRRATRTIIWMLSVRPWRLEIEERQDDEKGGPCWKWLYCRIHNEDIKKAEWQYNFLLHIYTALQRIDACSCCLSVPIRARKDRARGGGVAERGGGDREVGNDRLQFFNSSRMRPLACVKSDRMALSDKLVSAAKPPLSLSKTDRIWTFCWIVWAIISDCSTKSVLPRTCLDWAEERYLEWRVSRNS